MALSDSITDRVEHLTEFRNSETIAAYVATSEEVQTELIIRHALNDGKRVIVPKVVSPNRMIFSEIKDLGELEKSNFGIFEPKSNLIRPLPIEDAKVILVPLVAWDERGYRLGHGKGYYDSVLSGLAENLTVGLAFENQRVEQIPQDQHDVPLKMIVTEKRAMRFR